MSSRSIKVGVKTLLTENLDLQGLGYTILERYPRTINNSKGQTIVLWMTKGRETRFAGSGRSLGPVHGVKKIPWIMQCAIIAWGTAVETEYDAFEDVVDQICEIFRTNNTLGGYQAPEGTQVLNFGESMDIENIVPHYVGQFLRYQTNIMVTVEEIYNA